MSYPTLLFVHGASHGGWCWELLRPHLSAPFTALDLPGRGPFARDPAAVELEDWIEHVCQAVVRPDLRDVVLVGHSLAGILLPRVTARIPERLRHVVYVACAVPPEGQSIIDYLLGGVTLPTKVGPPDEASARAMFCNDMDPRQTQFVVENLCAEAGRPFREPMDLAGLACPVPRTYVKLLRDQSAMGDKQDEIIARLEPVHEVSLDSGHDAMISNPAALAQVLNALTRSRSSGE